jgi:hypothetical protein
LSNASGTFSGTIGGTGGLTLTTGPVPTPMRARPPSTAARSMSSARSPAPRASP